MKVKKRGNRKIQFLMLGLMICSTVLIYSGLQFSIAGGQGSDFIDDGDVGDVITIPAMTEKESTTVGDLIFDLDETTMTKAKQVETVTVTKEKQLPKVKVKKVVKKKSAKRLTVFLKAKIKGIDGYIVRVYTKKSYAKKNKKIVLTKKVKRNKKCFSIKSKKLKNRKKLFVRIYAYKNVNGKLSLASKGSDIKKVKVKK